MKKSVATKWIKALRSGKYKKGTGVLYDGKKHCALGVLCCLYSGSQSNWYLQQVCTDDVFEWAGFEDSASAYAVVQTLNDTAKFSFEKIAVYLESNWKNL